MKFCNPQDAKSVAGFLLRVSFGLSLLFVGIAHYMTLEGFAAMTSDGLGPLTAVGGLWAYILPALMIVGGALLAIGMYHHIAAWCAGLALASIPAGMLIKPLLSGVALPDVMPAAINAYIWLIVFVLVIKMCCGCCGGGSK